MSADDTKSRLMESSTAPSISTSIPSKKRKRTDDSNKISKTSSTPATKKPKTKKPKTKKAKPVAEDEDIDKENELNLKFSKMDSQLLSDYAAQKTRRFESDLSAIELADKHIPTSAIKDTSSFEKLRTKENLPNFLERFAECGDKKLWGSSKKIGSPHTLVVAGAGLRAAELAKALRPYATKEAMVAKLFAKHIKIAEQVKFLQHTRTGIAVGTPQRLEDLIDDGALNTSKLERIIIDASHIHVSKTKETKEYGILEMKDTQVALMKLLARKEFKERFAGGVVGGGGNDEKDAAPKIEILFY